MTAPAWEVLFVPHPEGFVEATFTACALENVNDVTVWEERVSAELAAMGSRVWLLIGLAGLRVKARAARSFGEARSRILQKFIVHSYRYGGDRKTLTSIATSRVIHGAEDNVFPTREEALAALLAAQKRQTI
jgi:hypothetical protein